MNIKIKILSLPKPIDLMILRSIYFFQEIVWSLKNKPAPPPHSIKIKNILNFAEKYHIKNFIETGTYLGETVQAVKKYFYKIYSIELNKDLSSRAKKIFKNQDHIQILTGDSANILPRVLNKLNDKSLFWLDAHYSGGVTSKGPKQTPILRELTVISRAKDHQHIILIDDARHFTGTQDYPTIKEIKKNVYEHFPDYKISIKHDIIRVYPK